MASDSYCEASTSQKSLSKESHSDVLSEAQPRVHIPLRTTDSADVNIEKSTPGHTKRGLKFWMCIFALEMCSYLITVDLAGVGTALPVIVSDLHGREFEWVGSAYALAATAFLPFTGGLAQVFGRKSILLMQVFIFAVGSAMCGAAPSMNFLIVSRTLQGIGSGGIASLTQIIVADLVPLQERGTFNGLIALAYAFGTSTAAVISGSLAQRGQWRWFFYLNLPICAICALLVATCLDLKVPRSTFREKIVKLDWIGNFLVISSTSSVVLGLTWGGIKFPWISAQVLVPLVLGVVGIFGFICYEAKIAKQPLVPFGVVSTRTGISGYIQGFFSNLYMLGCVYYLPIYMQACQLASPVGSGVDCFGLSFTLMPFGLVAGLTVAKSGKYRPQLWLAWVLLIIGGVLLMQLDANTSRAKYIGYQIIAGVGLGIPITAAFFPVLAPLPVSLNANALAFFMFVRYLAQVWGVTIGGAILQSELQKKLPTDFIEQFPSGTAVAYSIVPIIPTLEEPFRTNVRVAFAESLRVYWQTLTGIAAAGLLVSLLMKSLPLHTMLDKEWGFKQEVDSNGNVKMTEMSVTTSV